MTAIQTAQTDKISLDYTNSKDAAEIDLGIRDTIKGIRLSILAMGIALARIKMERMYRDLGFRNNAEYVNHLCEETKMDKSSLYKWFNIGKAYLKYKNELEQIGFNENDGPTKLPMLDRALETYEKHKVFENVKNMTVREFTVFSKNPSETDMTVNPVTEIKWPNVYIDGQIAVKLNSKMDREYIIYFKKVMRTACEVIEKGGLLYSVGLRNKREEQLFEKAARNYLAKLRNKTAK